ncbi:TPA: hypothetical protein HA318_00885 [Candidatus Micrarchaeota archaeon]|nr:hypothetical protein [Candidatus Micrarchaeota archaeon]
MSCDDPEGVFRAVVLKRDLFSSDAFYCRAEDSFVRVRSYSELEEGRAYLFKGECTRSENGLESQVEQAVLLSECDETELLCLIDSDVASRMQGREPVLLLDDVGLRSLSYSARECAKKIMGACRELRPILLRHHDDGDGICGALCLRAAVRDYLNRHGIPRVNLQFKAFQTGSSIYTLENARQDALDYGEAKPVLILLDLGSSDESREGRAAAIESGFEVICIDHHPFINAPAEATVVVSPFICGLNSDYCAGLLAFTVASCISVNVRPEWAWTAMKSDNSRFARREFEKQAVAVDYYAIDSAAPKTLDFYQGMLEDGRAIESAFAVASVKVARAVENAVQHVETVELGAGKALLVKVGKVLGNRVRYPSKGRLMNELQHRYAVKSGGAFASIGFEGDKVLVRANAAMAALGFNANLIIQELKREMPLVVESGGGHDVAASMKVKPERSREVVEAFLAKARLQVRGAA